MKLILASSKDSAGRNIATMLLKLYNFKPMSNQRDTYVYGSVVLKIIIEDVIRISSLPLTADEVIIASRHASESGRPTLTAHVPGEPSMRKLGLASPPTLKAALKALVVARDELALPYEVSLEATHHGPTDLAPPVTFMEIGSSPAQWEDGKAAEAVARAIMEAVTSPITGVQAVGFGGPHYAPRHTQAVLRTDICIGHILPKYLVFDEELVKHAIAKTRGGAELFALDWKGLNSAQRQFLRHIADKLGVRTIRESDLLAQSKGLNRSRPKMTSADNGRVH
jgi:D-aminoacyl-tRNA deacylase